MIRSAFALSLAAVLCAVSPSRAQVLDPPPFKPEITIYGDSIAKSVGYFVCQMVKVADLDYSCRVVAKDGLGSPAIAGMIPRKPHDIVILSMCTNDPNWQTCSRYLTVARQRLSGSYRAIFLVPVFPQWAPDLVRRAATGFNDEMVEFEPGCCSRMNRIHPKDSEMIALDVVRKIIGQR